MFLSHTAAAHTHVDEQVFKVLMDHPAFETSFYEESGLILNAESDYYVAFASVQSSESPLVCYYAAKLKGRMILHSGSYELQPQFMCDSTNRYRPFTGIIWWHPGSDRENHPLPAVGVGNLIVKPEDGRNIRFLPGKIKVKSSSLIGFQE